MDFSTHYFSRYKVLPPFFEDRPSEDTELIVIIPCLDDAFIFETLASLDAAEPAHARVEVIVNVNSGEQTAVDVVFRNKQIYERLRQEAATNHYRHFRLLPLLVEGTTRKKSGVGMARKTAMDEAVRRFAAIANPKGLIVSLDADTLVEKSYFQALEDAAKQPSAQCFTLQFRHRFEASHYPTEIIDACKQYEMYLRYYRLALKTFNFPFAIHTIGSCFAIRAEAYTGLGGMTPRQGGEDFYFLQKAVKMHPVFEIREPIVFPSPRISERVPFGTGPSVRMIVQQGHYAVYNFALFDILKSFYALIPAMEHEDMKSQIPSPLLEHIGTETFDAICSECRKYSSSSEAFTKRMYNHFDAFFVVKFLNTFHHSHIYPPIEVTEAAKTLLRHYGVHKIDNPYEQITALDLRL